MRSLLLLATASLALVGCKSMSYDAVTTHAAVGGFKIDATGLTGGYGQTDFSQTPVVDQKGKAITTPDACGAQNPLSTYSILSGNATASTNTTQGMSTAIAINRGQATGEAATELALAEVAKAVGSTGAAQYDVERAHRDCSKTASVLRGSPPPVAP